MWPWIGKAGKLRQEVNSVLCIESSFLPQRCRFAVKSVYVGIISSSIAIAVSNRGAGSIPQRFFGETKGKVVYLLSRILPANFSIVAGGRNSTKIFFPDHLHNLVTAVGLG